MRIGIYNRWLHALGGGERETGAFVQALAARHTVELLTHQPIDLALFAHRLNLELPPVPLRLLPLDPGYQRVADASAEYDLFVNISHGDLFVPRGRVNVLRVFFPGAATEPESTPSVPVAPSLARRIFGSRRTDKSQRASLRLESGFYRPETAGTTIFAWTGPRAEMLVPGPATGRRAGSPQLQLKLHGWRPPAAGPAMVRVHVEGALAAARELPPDGAWRDWRIDLAPGQERSEMVRVVVETTTFNPRDLRLSEDYRDLGIAIAAVRLVREGQSTGSAERSGNGVPDASMYDAMLARRARACAETYDLVLANSRYTQRWIERRWGLRSHVLYPPVDVDTLVPAGKRPLILSVGRFFAGAHNKKHLPMIRTFRELCDAGLPGWEYHLVGGADETMPEHRVYLQQVRAESSGYPIVIHANAPFEQLRELYATSAIFWHATGYGEDEEHAPESFEHFGIATVEAMAAGCVPVVIGRAGQVEIVEPGVSGFLWHTLAELEAHTRRLVDDPELREGMAQAARERSRRYAPERFVSEIQAIVAQIE